MSESYVERADFYMPPLLDWADIGYNFLVGEDGNVYEGRGWTQVGAQTLNYNSKSIGINRLHFSHLFTP